MSMLFLHVANYYIPGSELQFFNLRNISVSLCGAIITVGFQNMHCFRGDQWSTLGCILLVDSCCGFLKTWLPFLLLVGAVLTISLTLRFHICKFYCLFASLPHPLLLTLSSSPSPPHPLLTPFPSATRLPPHASLPSFTASMCFMLVVSCFCFRSSFTTLLLHFLFLPTFSNHHLIFLLLIIHSSLFHTHLISMSMSCALLSLHNQLLVFFSTSFLSKSTKHNGN